MGSQGKAEEPNRLDAPSPGSSFLPIWVWKHRDWGWDLGRNGNAYLSGNATQGIRKIPHSLLAQCHTTALASSRQRESKVSCDAGKGEHIWKWPGKGWCHRLAGAAVNLTLGVDLVLSKQPPLHHVLSGWKPRACVFCILLVLAANFWL